MIEHSAYLVAVFERGEVEPRLVGFDVFSEPRPTMQASRFTAVVSEGYGPSYAEAKAHLRTLCGHMRLGPRVWERG